MQVDTEENNDEDDIYKRLENIDHSNFKVFSFQYAKYLEKAREKIESN